MRRAALSAPLLALALSACSSGTEGTGAILRAGIAEVAGQVRPPAPSASAPSSSAPSSSAPSSSAPSSSAPSSSAPASQLQALGRADFEAAGRPVFRLRLLGRPRGTLFTSVTQNADVTGYATPLREYVGLRGAQIVVTRALGTDLLRSTSSPEDPLARPTPPAAWPAAVTRSFELPGTGPRGGIERYTCTFHPGEQAVQTILGLEIAGIEITESCVGPSGSFENLHFAELETGRVWRTIQWTGPDQRHIDIEVIVPGP